MLELNCANEKHFFFVLVIKAESQKNMRSEWIQCDVMGLK